MAAGHLDRVVAQRHADAPERPPDGAPRTEHPAVGEQRDHELGAGEGGGAQEPMHAAPEAAPYERGASRSTRSGNW